MKKICSRCGDVITHSFQPGRCYAEDCEPQEMDTHDEADDAKPSDASMKLADDFASKHMPMDWNDCDIVALALLIDNLRDGALEEAAMTLSSDYYEEAELAMRFMKRIRALKSEKKVKNERRY